MKIRKPEQALPKKRNRQMSQDGYSKRGLAPLAFRLCGGVLSIFLAGCNLAEKQTRFAVEESGSTGGKGMSVPVNQMLTPAGLQVELPGARPQVLALSPDGKLLAIGGKNELVLIDPLTGKVLQT